MLLAGNFLAADPEAVESLPPGGTAIDPERKAPRLPCTGRFQAYEGWTAELVDVSAVGVRVRLLEAAPPVASQVSGVIEFDDGATAEIRVRVVWAEEEAHGHASLVGLELREAGRQFYDALPLFRPTSN